MTEVRLGLDQSSITAPPSLGDPKTCAEEVARDTDRGSVEERAAQSGPVGRLEEFATVRERMPVNGDRRLPDRDPREVSAAVPAPVERVASDRERDGARLLVLRLRDSRRERGFSPRANSETTSRPRGAEANSASNVSAPSVYQ